MILSWAHPKLQPMYWARWNWSMTWGGSDHCITCPWANNLVTKCYRKGALWDFWLLHELCMVLPGSKRYAHPLPWCQSSPSSPAAYKVWDTVGWIGTETVQKSCLGSHGSLCVCSVCSVRTPCTKMLIIALVKWYPRPRRWLAQAVHPPSWGLLKSG